ncbi:metalloregulator ArsR/SmtB family transcription factor [Glycomyces dulcitolivorans]|uniref:metalloregulator ArsR/SmtB family transcription factor n=1 Tax=Glycomyces dulcitolivorans TaxID=2200759 RepID=UPI000DD2E5DA|nr:metalloregulator ArsR/SmtB family transcription factor [Glycomyces dulcitolivorans]
MDRIASSLGDATRWRIVELLVERPRSVGELSELTGLRQPQTTKHLQNLGRAGLVSATPLGQRRIYTAEPAALAAFGDRLLALAAAARANEGERDVIARYQAAIEADTAAAQQDQWADGRAFSFGRDLAAPPDAVWRHWTDARLLASWWVPPSMTVTDCAIEPVEGGRVVLDYRDAEGHYRSKGVVRAAEAPGRLVFDLSVLDAEGAVFFTGHYDLTLADSPQGTNLRLELTITETTVAAVPFIAGIATGWGQVLDNLARTIDDATRPTT